MDTTGVYRGRWHGPKVTFGFHRDLHVEPSDTGIGSQGDPAVLAEMTRRAGGDFIQVDSKGHPGWTSWPSRTPTASVAPGIVKDPLAQWAQAARKLGVPLHAHYSGTLDKACGAKHPDWCVVRADGTHARAAWAGVLGETGDKMCPRSPYVDELLVPQVLEMVERYGISGLWVDGDIWATEPCWCGRCTAAFREQAGQDPPTTTDDPLWPAWWNFTRESFEAYVTRYVEALHAAAPSLLVCSNWLQTFRHPGAPSIRTDWISGDNSAVWGMDSGRCEARFISTRGKPWDIMLWDFYFSHGWLGEKDWAPSVKPVEMLQQEAAVIVALGGNFQVCDNPFSGLRQGQMARWRIARVGEVARFVKKRRALCAGAETIPQCAVLHSEHHARSRPVGGSPRDIDTAPVQGAVFSLLECSRGVDIMDEWALLPRLQEFPVVVCPEQDRMSDAAVAALRGYVTQGGRLVLSGAAAFDRFGADLLGARRVALKESAVLHLPSGRQAVAAFSASWALVRPTSARGLAALGETPSRDERLLPFPWAVVNRVGKGTVAWIPFDLFRDYSRNRYPMVRELVREAVHAVRPRFEIEAEAPAAVDVILRRKGARRIVHLVNRASGLPTLPNTGAVDEIPPVGPVTITVHGTVKRAEVKRAFENGELSVKTTGKGAAAITRITVPSLRIHAAVVMG